MSGTVEQSLASEAGEGPMPDNKHAGGGSRRFASGLFWLLASLGIMVSSVTLWAHQSILTTEGWTDAVGEIASDPEVIETAGVVVVDRVSEALDLRSIVVDVLPAGELIGGIATARLEEVLADVVSDVISTEGFQETFAEVNRIAYDQGLTLVRGGDEIVSAQGGAIHLNVFPLIEVVLGALKDTGVIEQAAVIPDLTEYRPPIEAVTQLEAVLGRELPNDIGTIQLVDSDRVAVVQQGLRNFDLITILAMALTVLLAVLAIALARYRLRMVLWLAMGAVAAVGFGRAFARSIMDAITGAVADGPGGDTVRAVTTAAVDRLTWFTVAVAAGALIIALIVWRVERRARKSAAGDTGAAPISFPTWVHEHSVSLSIGGLVVIGLLVVGQITGPDVALLAAAAAAVWLIGIRVIADEPNHVEPAVEHQD